MALRDLPSFKSTKGIAPAPSFVPQSQGEIAGFFTQLSGSIENQFLQRSLEGAASAGEAAGSQLGAKAPRSNITDADRAYIKAFNTAQSGAIQMDVRSNLQNIADEVTAPGNLNSNSIEQYQAQAGGYLKGLIQTVPANLQQKTANYFNYYNQQNSHTVDSKVNKLNQNKLASGYFNYSTNSIRDIQSAAFAAPANGDVDNIKAGALYGQLAQQTEEAVTTGLITPKMGDDILKRAKSDAQQEHYLGQFDIVLNQDDQNATKKWVKNFQSSRKADLTPEEQRDLVVKMIGLQRERSSLIQTNNAVLIQDKKNAISMIEHGASDNDVLGIIERVNKFDNEKGQQAFFGDLKAAQLQRDINNVLRGTPPSQVNEVLNQLKPEKKDAFFSQKSKVFDKVQQAQTQFRKELLDDPANYALSTETVQASVEQDNLSAGDPRFDTSFDINFVTPNVGQSMINVQRDMEVPETKLSLFPKQALEAFGNSIADKPFVEQLQAVEQEVGKFDNNLQYIALRDLRKAGISAAHVLVMNADYARTPETSAMIPQMIQAFSEDKQELKKAITSGQDTKGLRQLIADNNDQYHASLLNYKAPTETTISELIDEQEHYALWLMARKGVSADKASQMAGNVINAAYDFQELRGSVYRIPRYIQTTNNMEPVIADVQSIKNQADLLITKASESEDIFVPDEYLVGVSDELARINYINDLKAHSTIMTTPDNQSIAVIDAYGSIVKTNDGELFQSTFADIQNNASDIKQEFTKKFSNSRFGRAIIMRDIFNQPEFKTIGKELLEEQLGFAFEGE